MNNNDINKLNGCTDQMKHQTCQVHHDHQFDPNHTIEIRWRLTIEHQCKPGISWNKHCTKFLTISNRVSTPSRV